MRFPYLPLPTARPIPSLGGSSVRHRPIVPLRIIGPQGSRLLDCSIDCGTDDTIFSTTVATRLGIDLTNAPQGQGQPIGMALLPYRYAAVSLRLSDGHDTFEWKAVVEFVNVSLRWPLLGYAGFLQYFDVKLLGQQREVVIDANASFSGQRA